MPAKLNESEPPIVHNTTMNVAADKAAVVTPVAKSTGASVASLTSSAMRFSGFL
jgi:hypothetical protein